MRSNVIQELQAMVGTIQEISYSCIDGSEKYSGETLTPDTAQVGLIWKNEVEFPSCYEKCLQSRHLCVLNSSGSQQRFGQYC